MKSVLKKLANLVLYVNSYSVTFSSKYAVLYTLITPYQDILNSLIFAFAEGIIYSFYPMQLVQFEIHANI